MPRYIQGRIRKVTTVLEPIITCDRCGNWEYGKPVTVESSVTDDLRNLSIIDTNRVHVDIRPGWGQNGRGNYICPKCTKVGCSTKESGLTNLERNQNA